MRKTALLLLTLTVSGSVFAEPTGTPRISNIVGFLEQYTKAVPGNCKLSVVTPGQTVSNNPEGDLQITLTDANGNSDSVTLVAGSTIDINSFPPNNTSSSTSKVFKARIADGKLAYDSIYYDSSKKDVLKFIRIGSVACGQEITN